ncbi:HNH endonuclease [Rhizobium bangladeshense]|uniref:HNH endonuclease n=1 Tax=Rhizobium bangladeshense TaxID=1138189 RepID=UPI001C831635|nr:HNH endonuclease [Rhizobium bangladeshense]MBX4920976.1 HNH endonuclease [Rhizobium bangladeshense]
MSNRFWAGQWPNLNNISIVLHGTEVDILTPEELGILYRLVWFVASQSVHKQLSAPSEDPGFPFDRAHFIARCSRAEWEEKSTTLSSFFHIGADGIWRLKNFDWVRLSKDIQRSPIPAGVRAATLQRDAARCVYCGDEDGPFHFDHLLPVSKGGSDAASNIVIACIPCNLSKGDKTLLEWMASR